MNTTIPSSTARVALVTGASRGAGKGIALALGAAGMTIHVTRRSRREGDAERAGNVPHMESPQFPGRVIVE